MCNAVSTLVRLAASSCETIFRLCACAHAPIIRTVRDRESRIAGVWHDYVRIRHRFCLSTGTHNESATLGSQYPLRPARHAPPRHGERHTNGARGANGMSDTRKERIRNQTALREQSDAQLKSAWEPGKARPRCGSNAPFRPRRDTTRPSGQTAPAAASVLTRRNTAMWNAPSQTAGEAGGTRCRKNRP